MRVATLGPPGTCSEEVALAYLLRLGHDASNSLSLAGSFEQAVEWVLGDQADRAIVPAAYVRFHEVVFRNIGRLAVADILYSKTPAFVLCGQEGLRLAPEGREYRLASHASPAPLAKRVGFAYELVDAPSNSAAARMAAAGDTELCITNRRALEVVNRDESSQFRLEVLEHYGSVEMVWAVFERGTGAMEDSFWRGGLLEGPPLTASALSEWLDESGISPTDADALARGARLKLTVEGVGCNGERPTALFIDDEPSAFAHIPEDFPRWHWIYAANVDDAMKTLCGTKVTAALVDIGLAGDDGHDDSGVRLVESLRRGHPGIAILMITGYARDAELATRCFRLGALDYMRKPLDLDRLESWLSLLERRWRLRAIEAKPCTVAAASDAPHVEEGTDHERV